MASLHKPETDRTTLTGKKRLCTPATAGQFAPMIIRPADNWKFEIAKSTGNGKQGGDVEMILDEFIRVYDLLADGATKSLGLDDRSTVRKVSVTNPKHGPISSVPELSLNLGDGRGQAAAA